MAVFSALVLDGQRWMVAGQRSQDWSVVGREVTRPATSHSWSFEPDQLRNVTAGNRTSEFRAFADWLAGDKGARPLTGGRHFYNSDYTVLRTDAFVASVRMYSARTVNARCVNDEGTQSEHTADGVLNLYYSGHEYDEMYPVWNWKQLPGTTVVQYPQAPSCSTTLQHSLFTFVGGTTSHSASTGAPSSTLSAMKLRSHGMELMRVFVMRPEVLVTTDAFTNYTDAGHHTPVVTTAANCRLAGDVTVQLANETSPRVLPRGAHNISAAAFVWAHHGNTGYACALFPCPPVYIVNSAQSGDWSWIGVSSGTVTKDVFTLLYNRGTDLQADTFSHLMFPNVTAKAMPDVAKSVQGSVSVTSNSSSGAVSVLVSHANLTNIRDNTDTGLAAHTQQHLPGGNNGYTAYDVLSNGGSSAMPQHGVSSVDAPTLAVTEVGNGNALQSVSISSPAKSGEVKVEFGSGLKCSGRDSMRVVLPDEDRVGDTVQVACT